MFQINVAHFPWFKNKGSPLFDEQEAFSRVTGMTLDTYTEKNLYYNPVVHPEQASAGNDLRMPNVDDQSMWTVKDADVKMDPSAFKDALLRHLPL